MFLSSSSRICFLIYVSCTLGLIIAENLRDVTKWMCVDEKCSDPISLSTVSKQYIPDDSNKIAVRKGDKVEILRKPADSFDKYYYVKSLVNSKKGLISKDFIRETKIYRAERDLIEVELNTKSIKNKRPEISPSAPTNVYDGTTIVESYEDMLYPHEPTQSRGQPNDVGSPSVVQSTTPPSFIGDDSLSSLNSAEVESKNASEEEHKSKYPSSEPSASPDSSIIPESTPSSPLDDDGVGISSTPASTMNNEPSQSHGIHKDADIIQPTTEMPISPEPILIHKSQTQENLDSFQEANGVEDVNGTNSNGLQSVTTEEEETILTNIAATLKSLSPFGNDDPTEEPETLESIDELQVEMESDREQMESGANIKKDTESVQATGQDPSVVESVNPENHVRETATVSADVEPESSDLSVEQSSANIDFHRRVSELVDSVLEEFSDPAPGDELSSDSSSSTVTVNITETNFPNSDLANIENPNLIGSSISDSPSTSSQNVTTEQQSSFQNVANQFDQHVADIQSSNQNTTSVDPGGPPSERLPSSVESNDAVLSQNNNVKYERLPTKPPLIDVPAVDLDEIVEISADSEEGDSNIKFESTKSEGHSDANDPVKTQVRTEKETLDSVIATVGQSDSDSTIEESSESHKVVEEPSPSSSAFLFSSNLDFVDPRSSDIGVSINSPDVQVPAVTEGPTTAPESTNIVPNAHIDQEVDEDITTPLSEPSYQTSVTEGPTNVPDSENIVPDTHVDKPVPEVDEDITTPPPDPETGTELPQIVNADVEKSFKEPPSLIEEGSSDPWYSSVFSAFDSIQELFSGRAPESEVIPTGDNTPEVTPEFQVDEKSETCTTEACDRHQVQFNPGTERDDNYLVEDHVWLSPRGLILMIITAIAVLLFSLGHYYLENLKRDVELVSKYNDLAGKLFIEQKEKEMLAEQLTSVNESMTQISFDTTKYDEEIADLKTLVQKYKEEKCNIEEKEKETRKKLMMVDKNYNELRNILSQNKQKGERSALILDIRNLKDSIAGNNIEIASLKEQLLEKKDEIKSLNVRVMEIMETNKQLEENVEKAISENHETAQKYQDNIAKLEKTIEESTFSRVKLEKECAQLKKEKESLAIEKELAESSLQKFQRLKPSNSLTEWLDAKGVRVSLLAAEKKIEELTAIRDVLTREKILVEEKERALVVDLEQLNEKYEKAEKEKIEALTKLQVLSDYFKEKETQLQEELGSKESLWLQKQSDDRTIYEQMRALREENTSFKNQNETLKREILDQEASFKKLITSAEEKAHENWVALRHHERRLKEAQMEASQLRSRLTTLEANGDNSDDKMNKGEVNGDIPPFGSATSPPFMLYPEFVPPPPLLSNTPSRPPPLGRISSPPLGDFTPPPPLVPYEMFLPPSPPPPAPHVLHKPQPLDGSHRIQKDSQSSNHSTESVPDRPRRNKR